MSRHKSQDNQKVRWLVLFSLVIAAILWYTGAIGKLTGSSALSEQDRQELYSKALVQAAGSSVWPKTERELITAFWSAIASNNLKKATLYCPGSTESDYTNYARLKPSGKIRIGEGQLHPRSKGVMLWPTQVSFTYFGNKTIKLATAKSPSGQPIIDGQHSIWW